MSELQPNIFSIYSIHGFGRPRTSSGRAQPLINPNFCQQKMVCNAGLSGSNGFHIIDLIKQKAYRSSQKSSNSKSVQSSTARESKDTLINK